MSPRREEGESSDRRAVHLVTSVATLSVHAPLTILKSSV